MIRFRVGHSWQRETAAPGGPRDAFGLEIEGLNLLDGANDEPLPRIIDALVETVTHLAIDGERAGQVSLEDVHLELCFWRTGRHDVDVSVIDLSQPPRQVRAPISIELTALVDATVRCARAFLRDVGQHREGIEAELVNLERRLKRLTGAAVTSLPAADLEAPWRTSSAASQGVGFELLDDGARTEAWSRKTRAGLPPLLFAGAVLGPEGVRVEGLPFLTMLGLARAATEGGARLAGRPVTSEAVFRAGLELCLTLRAHHPALGSNPYVEALQVRCTDGLTALRQPIPDTTSAAVPAPRPAPSVPLVPTGSLRRVTLEARWSRPVALGEDGGRILLGKSGVIVHSPHAVHVFSRQGATGFRLLAQRGVAVAATGEVLAAMPERLFGFAARSKTADWFRDHDGLSVGPRAERVGEVLVCKQGHRTVSAFALPAGRTVWRFEPQRTQQVHVSVSGPRVLVGTDGGTLFGIDAADGQIRFKVKASLPVVHPALALRNRAVAVLNRGEHTAVYACEAMAGGETTPAGALVWTKELLLTGPSAPVAARGRLWLGGQRDGQCVVLSLGARGQLLFERAIPCDARTLRLLPFAAGVLATDARGAAVRLGADGRVEWVLGSSGDELGHAVAPRLARRTLVVPGPTTRLVEPESGRVLAELPTGARTLDVAVDDRLTIFVLREPGTLETFTPGTALSVVSAG